MTGFLRFYPIHYNNTTPATSHPLSKVASTSLHAGDLSRGLNFGFISVVNFSSPMSVRMPVTNTQ